MTALQSGTVVSRLGSALRRYCEAVNLTPGMVAKRTGIPTRHGWDCAADRVCPVESHLRLAALLGLDPATGKPAEPAMPPRRGPVSWPFFATGLRGRILVDRLTVRDAARLSGVSPATVSRATDAQTIALASFLALSRFLKRHPNEWTAPGPGDRDMASVFHDEQALKRIDPAEETVRP